MVFLKYATTVEYMKSSAEKRRYPFGYTRAEFLNFSIYLSFPK